MQVIYFSKPIDTLRKAVGDISFRFPPRAHSNQPRASKFSIYNPDRWTAWTQYSSWKEGHESFRQEISTPWSSVPKRAEHVWHLSSRWKASFLERYQLTLVFHKLHFTVTFVRVVAMIFVFFAREGVNWISFVRVELCWRLSRKVFIIFDSTYSSFSLMISCFSILYLAEKRYLDYFSTSFARQEKKKRRLSRYKLRVPRVVWKMCSVWLISISVVISSRPIL